MSDFSAFLSIGRDIAAPKARPRRKGIKRKEAHLQFRWEPVGEIKDWGMNTWCCHYELSLPLWKYDVRRENDSGKRVRSRHVVEIGNTTRTSNWNSVPCLERDGSYYFDAPFRDRAHARWDAEVIGNLPIVCIAVDGTVIHPPDEYLDIHRPKD